MGNSHGRMTNTASNENDTANARLARLRTVVEDVLNRAHDSDASVSGNSSASNTRRRRRSPSLDAGTLHNESNARRPRVLSPAALGSVLPGNPEGLAMEGLPGAPSLYFTFNFPISSLDGSSSQAVPIDSVLTNGMPHRPAQTAPVEPIQAPVNLPVQEPASQPEASTQPANTNQQVSISQGMPEPSNLIEFSGEDRTVYDAVVRQAMNSFLQNVNAEAIARTQMLLIVRMQAARMNAAHRATQENMTQASPAILETTIPVQENYPEETVDTLAAQATTQAAQATTLAAQATTSATQARQPQEEPVHANIFTSVFLLMPTDGSGTTQPIPDLAAPNGAIEQAFAAINAFLTGTVGNSYEDMIRLQEMLGIVSRGAPMEHIDAQLVPFFWKEAMIADDGVNCTICLEEYVSNAQMRRLPCQHTYHSDCISTWLKTCNRCPLCRDTSVKTPSENISIPE